MSETGREPFKLWTERPLPDRYVPMLDGIAVVVGNGADGDRTGLAEAEAVIASARIGYDAALMEMCPRLRVIARTGMGVDNVAVADASARGIVVCNVPDGPTTSTAEHTLALLLAVAKQLKGCDRAVRTGQQDHFSVYRGIELNGLVLGLVGLGQIGGRVATLAQAIGMSVIAFDPFLAPERAAELGAVLVPELDDLLAGADAVSLHVPLTPETHHLLDARGLALMKPQAVLVNAARGGLIDEVALVDALDRGRLAGAGLDVFEHEPPPVDHPLLGREDVVATPHIAAATEAGRDRLWRSAIAQALQVLRGERPPHAVNAVAAEAGPA